MQEVILLEFLPTMRQRFRAAEHIFILLRRASPEIQFFSESLKLRGFRARSANLDLAEKCKQMCSSLK